MTAMGTTKGMHADMRDDELINRSRQAAHMLRRTEYDEVADMFAEVTNRLARRIGDERHAAPAPTHKETSIVCHYAAGLDAGTQEFTRVLQSTVSPRTMAALIVQAFLKASGIEVNVETPRHEWATITGTAAAPAQAAAERFAPEPLAPTDAITRHEARAMVKAALDDYDRDLPRRIARIMGYGKAERG
jgi:hypothetical protein